MGEPQFPLWAFITEMAAIPLAFIFFVLLSRRLRLVHPAMWEKLGRPDLMMLHPGSFLGFLDLVEANFRLYIFPFRSQSFGLGNWGTAILLWLARVTLGLIVVFGGWSWWANHYG